MRRFAHVHQFEQVDIVDPPVVGLARQHAAIAQDIDAQGNALGQGEADRAGRYQHQRRISQGARTRKFADESPPGPRGEAGRHRARRGGVDDVRFRALPAGAAADEAVRDLEGKADVVLVFENERSIRNVQAGKFTLGGEASAIGGPMGRRASGVVTGKAQVYAYIHSRGLFAATQFESARGGAVSFTLAGEATGAWLNGELVRPGATFTANARAGLNTLVLQLNSARPPAALGLWSIALPTTIDTPQNRAAMPGADTSRWVTPTEVAEAMAFLLSSAANGVTGQLLQVG